MINHPSERLDTSSTQIRLELSRFEHGGRFGQCHDQDLGVSRIAQAQLKQQLFSELKAQQDPRMFGDGAGFEQYPYSDPSERDFYDRFMRGEKLRPGWVNDSDFEKVAR